MATGINGQGAVVGWSQTGAADFVSQGFVAPAGGTVATASPIVGLGGATTFARAINEQGTVTGDGDDGTRTTHAFLWRPGSGILRIASPPAGAAYVIARAINTRDEVVGDGPSSSGESEAWHWDHTSGKRILDSLVDRPAGWRIQRAWGIANNGTIVATARTAAGQDVPVLLRRR